MHTTRRSRSCANSRKNEPKQSDLRLDLTNALVDMGDLLVDDKNPDGADDVYLEALAIAHEFVPKVPKEAEWRDELVAILLKLAVIGDDTVAHFVRRWRLPKISSRRDNCRNPVWSTKLSNSWPQSRRSPHNRGRTSIHALAYPARHHRKAPTTREREFPLGQAAPAQSAKYGSFSRLSLRRRCLITSPVVQYSLRAARSASIWNSSGHWPSE